MKNILFKHKNNKFHYYATNFLNTLIPPALFESQLNHLLSQLSSFDKEYILTRVNYYNQLNQPKDLAEDKTPLHKFKLQKKHKTYFFDTYASTKYFPKNLNIHHSFGDITQIPLTPSFVKSRPIEGDISNAIILKLNKIRHFNFINDTKSFRSKKDMLVGRFNGDQTNRLKFLEMYINHPQCNVGQIFRKNKQRPYVREYVPISEQLNYKFVLCLEGHDVATSLKWVMSSNSIAIMPKPRYETWFMEGTLIPNYHYIEIKDDYTDLEEKMNYYIQNPDMAEVIIKNANNYVEQFKNKKQERLISLHCFKKIL